MVLFSSSAIFRQTERQRTQTSITPTTPYSQPQTSMAIPLPVVRGLIALLVETGVDGRRGACAWHALENMESDALGKIGV